MKSNKISNEDAMEKGKIDVVYYGVNTNERDINYSICCSGQMFAFRG